MRRPNPANLTNQIGKSKCWTATGMESEIPNSKKCNLNMCRGYSTVIQTFFHIAHGLSLLFTFISVWRHLIKGFAQLELLGSEGS